MRIGVDTGGTFTDFVRLGKEGLVVDKRRSTPADPSRAILDGLTGLAPAGTHVDVVHGSTVATNAVLERAGARVALVTTAGFEDVLRIGRQTRPELYNLFVPPPRPLVEPALTFGVIERLDAQGTSLVDVDDASVERVVSALRATDVEIVAVCLLHAYANPAHEQQVATALRRAGFVVCTSHEVLPEYREYERWSTTVVNAYVTPIMARYLARLEAQVPGRLSILQSNGGTISAASARAQAVRTVLSGPAGGVVGARAVAREAGFPRIISFDMGGTSTDVSLIDRDISTSTESRVGDFPVRLPVLDIHTVGAGGGSIAHVDPGGALRVGPESAGARPGPVCYGEGRALTVTDANVLLGRLDPDHFLAGRMTIDVARARAVGTELARALKLPVLELAEGIVRVANANMERAIRVVSIERGHDPRRFALLAFGGAGGMHACEIARELGMTRVLVPRYAGVLSALGMLVADVTRDYSASVRTRSDALPPRRLATMFSTLAAQASQDLAREGFTRRHQVIERLVDVRYVGQSFEITVPWTPEYRAAFDRQHARQYGYANPARATEVVAVRVRGIGVTDKPELPRVRVRRPFRPTPIAVRAGRFDGRQVPIAYHRWAALEPGAAARGPAVITGGEATVVIPPDFSFRIDGFGNVLATRRGRTEPGRVSGVPGRKP